MSKPGRTFITNRTLASSGPDTPTQRTAALIVIYGTGLGQRVSVDAGAVLIGRSEDADLQLAHPSVSRRHCMIWRESGRHRIRDLGSTNRTRLNEEILGEEPRYLADGDHITIGENILKFVDDASIEAPYHAEVYQRVTRDALTGINNRRHFLELANRELARAHRHGRPLALCMIDIDLFKRINDTWGHAEGDQVLRNVARTIAARARSEDSVARIGGEEFAILFPETSMDVALGICERLRKDVQKLPFELGDKHEVITISVGVAIVRADDSVATLMQRADQALYKAKSMGRNTTCQAGDSAD